MNKIIIHSIPKSGTTTIARSLEERGIGVIRSHDLFMSQREHNSEIKNIVENTELKKIITFIREPISRNISAYFHFTVVSFPNLTSKDIPIFIDYFKTQYIRYLPLEWFDLETKPLTGIDVYSKSFNHEVGYEIYESEFFDLLVIRTEDIDNSAKKAIERFLQIEKLKIINKNITVDSNRRFSDLYNKFLKEIKFSNEYLDMFYETRYMKHFYTDDEINGFRDRWIQT